jgi:release factor glutamine methyltransferase
MKMTDHYIEKELAGLYPDTEIKGLKRIILETVCGWGFTEQITKRDETIPEGGSSQIKAIVARLKNAEPIQYVLGETEFFGLKLKVNPAVLIPRPETLELVEWVLQSKLPDRCNILDIGTGSGCIALAIKKNIRDARVSAIDISEKALEIARLNADINNLGIEFFQADILHLRKIGGEKYDVIVSNPPYVRESEKAKMHNNVLCYEPGIALFVDDKDPLVFYNAIAIFAKENLTANGQLFFEINEKLGEEMSGLLSGLGFTEIEIRKDINGKNRMIRCVDRI